MKKILAFQLILMTMLIGLCCSCTNSESLPYGTRIEEDLSTVNMIDDNYRNYYEIFVRSFYDSDGDKIGDLKGVTQKLDYIKTLGYNGIWLMPINPSPSYHKYNVSDYYGIDSSYGTMEDLEELIVECHKRDIKLIIDLVLNHSSKSCSYFSKAVTAYQKSLIGQPLTAEDEKYKDFYVFYPSKNDVPKSVTAYKAPGYSFYYEANFDSDMPEFNCDSEAVQAEFQNIIKFYLDKGIDGFRLDAVKYYYYTSSVKNIEFLSKINQWAKAINPNAYIVGECWDGYGSIKNYYDSGCDSFFNFSTSVTNPTGSIINGINREGKGLKSYYEGMISNYEISGDGISAPFLNNHDTPRFTSSGNPTVSMFQFALLAMMNGTVFSYYGDEVGMVGDNTGTKPDQNVRTPIMWGEPEHPDCSEISGVTERSYPYPTVSEQMNDSSSIYSFYKKVLLVRNQNPEIARGSISLIEMEREIDRKLFIAKEYNGNKIGIIFNFSPTQDMTVSFTEHGFSSVVGQIVTNSNEKYIGMQKDGSIKMPPYSIAIVR